VCIPRGSGNLVVGGSSGSFESPEGTSTFFAEGTVRVDPGGALRYRRSDGA